MKPTGVICWRAGDQAKWNAPVQEAEGVFMERVPLGVSLNEEVCRGTQYEQQPAVAAQSEDIDISEVVLMLDIT